MDWADVGAPLAVYCSSQHPSTHSAHHPPTPACQYRKTVLVSAAQTGSDFMLWRLLQLSSLSYFALNRLAVSDGWHINEVKALSVILYVVHKHTACTALLVKMRWEDWTGVNITVTDKEWKKTVANSCKRYQNQSAPLLKWTKLSRFTFLMTILVYTVLNLMAPINKIKALILFLLKCITLRNKKGCECCFKALFVDFRLQITAQLQLRFLLCCSLLM